LASLPVRLYASFPADRSGGNMAGVVYDDAGLGPAGMQSVAADLGVATTGFVRKQDQASYDVRFFSTRSEMGMCGHVTVAIFTSLFDDGLIPASPAEYQMTTPAGQIAVDIAPGAGGAQVWMRQLSPRFGLVSITAEELAPLLGIRRAAICSIGSSSTALNHVLVQLADLAALSSIHPDDAGLRALSYARSIDTVGVWSLRDAGPGTARVRVRDLCHGVGDPEEAASGTTNGALACFLVDQGLARSDDRGIITVTAEQGFEMGRPSLISSRLRTSGHEVIHVQVGGRSERRLTGTYLL
jgi:trans-2,3-dihydro-3-hydroxyanthranilate isomerase